MIATAVGRIKITYQLPVLLTRRTLSSEKIDMNYRKA